MDNSDRPIGIFDSGLGGLTAVKAVRESMPCENIIYLGDSARLPYGNKTKEEIITYAGADVGFLIKMGVKAVFIACNSADSAAKEEIEKRYPVPVIGVVAPAAHKAAKKTKNHKIGVLATRATVLTRIYENTIKTFLPESKVFCVAAPLLVSLVEAGKAYKGNAEMEAALNFYLSEFIAEDVDTLILGCTHFPLFYNLITDIMPDVNVICSGKASVPLLKNELESLKMLNGSGKVGNVSFFVTGEVRQFERCGEFFLGKSIKGKVQKITL